MHMQNWMLNAQKLNFLKFNHSYASNPYYSDALKLAHLQQRLEDEPLDIIEQVSVDDESFTVGWDILEDRHEDPRLIHYAPRHIAGSRMAQRQSTANCQRSSTHPQQLYRKCQCIKGSSATLGHDNSVLEFETLGHKTTQRMRIVF